MMTGNPQSGSAAVVIHNFRRPQNLPRIVTACLESRRVRDVFVIDNASDDSLGLALAQFVDMRSDRVTYRANFNNRGAGFRFSFAATLDCPVVLSIDDDLFLMPTQIDGLIDAFQSEPSRVHGLWGEKLVEHNGNPKMINSIVRKNVAVDVLNRVYAFSPGHAEAACGLLRELGHEDWLSLGPGCDILLSFSGEKRPLVHDLGELAQCETSGAKGIAFWRDKDFKERRLELTRKLVRLRPQDRTF